MKSHRCQAFAISVVALALMFGCGSPTQQRVIKDFQQRHPNYIVLDANSGEGDSDDVYWYVRYRKPDSDPVFLAEWLYQKEKGGEWKLTWQNEPPQPCGKTSQDCVLPKG